MNIILELHHTHHGLNEAAATFKRRSLSWFFSFIKTNFNTYEQFKVSISPAWRGNSSPSCCSVNHL